MIPGILPVNVTPLRKISLLTAATMVLCVAPLCPAQESSENGSWSSTSQQGDAQGNANPTRSIETHSAANGRSVDHTSVEAKGPDGRYVPYSETEKESVQVDATTVRTIERTFGRGPDGQRTLIQQTEEESRTLPGGETKVARTTSNPDADGRLQVVRSEMSDSKQVSAGVRVTNTTVSSADGSGGLSAAVKTEEIQKQTSPGVVEFKKSTSLADGTGRWTISEVREGTTRQETGQGMTKEESVSRPDADGKLALVERTVSKLVPADGGEQRETTETFSANVPGQAGDEGLKLVKRESTVQRTVAGGDRTTVRQVEQPNPGDPGAGLRVTQEAIDIVRTGANGVARQQSTIMTTDANGQMNAVWIDIGSSDKPAAVKVDAKASPKGK